MAADVLSEAKSRLDSLLAPINGGVGADVSYDEAFEALKNEVDKLTALSGGKVDWGAVASGASDILSDKSKDFRVALYFAAAKTHTDGLLGLLDGLVLVQELTAAFWEPMYPPLKRPKARGNLVSWYADIATAAFSSFQPSASDSDVVRAIDAASSHVDGELREKLGDDNYPGMMNLRNVARSLVASLPKEAPPAPPPSAAAPASASRAPSPSAAAAPASLDAPVGGIALPSVTSITGLDDATTVATQCGLLLSRAGDAIRIADPGNPLAYRYGRTGFWLELNQSPPAEGNVTLVPPPPDGLKAQFDSMMAAENYLAVIHAADEASATYLLWLDPHRYIANAMDRLGAVFINAKKALVREVAALLTRAPKLAELSFNDGTPMADAATKMWIDAEVRAAMGGDSKANGSGGGAASALDGPIAEARTLAASGKLPEAIETVTRAAASAPSGADRFRGRLAVAKLCLDAGQLALARAQLEGLTAVVEQHHLAEWDPELCTELFAALYAAHRGLNRGDEVSAEARAREAAAFERLCQFDAGRALKLSAD